MTSAPVRIRRLQIYGERCSGTNWIASLLRRNLPGLRIVDDFGWKHGWIYGEVENAADCVFVVVHRDPFDWLRSLHRRPWHTAPELRGVPFAQFIRTPWRCLWGADMDLPAGDPRIGTEMLHERDPQTGLPFANVLKLRSAKMLAWQELSQRARHSLFVRHETVLEDPRRFVREAARQLALWRWPWFRAVDRYKGGRLGFRPKIYPPIDAGDLAFIQSELDPVLERRHGFDLDARAAELVHEGSAQ